MCSWEMFKSIEMQKFIENFSPKNIPCSSGGNCEPSLIFFRITPHKITQRSIMWYFLEPFQTLYLLNRLNQRWESSMNCKNTIVYVHSNWKVIENIGEVLPNYCVSIFCLTLHVKSIVLGYCSGLVVSSDHHHFVRILYLEKAKQCDDLDTVSASIYIITEE